MRHVDVVFQGMGLAGGGGGGGLFLGVLPFPSSLIGREVKSQSRCAEAGNALLSSVRLPFLLVSPLLLIVNIELRVNAPALGQMLYNPRDHPRY